MPLPKEWLQYKANWCDSITPDCNIDAEILLGSDQARLHPRDALTNSAELIQSDHARLKISVLTGKYIAHGFNNFKDNKKNSPIAINTINIDQPQTANNQSHIIQDESYNHTTSSDAEQSSDETELTDLANEFEVGFNSL